MDSDYYNISMSPALSLIYCKGSCETLFLRTGFSVQGVVSFYSLAASSSLIKERPLTDAVQRGQVVFDNEGKIVLLISKSQTFPEEKDNAPEKPEKFETKLAEKIYKQKTDGRGCLIQVINLETWEVHGPFKVPATFDKDGIRKISGDTISHIRYSNPCFSV